MKVIQSSVVRALVAIVVGVMLILYRMATLEWMVIITGALFFLSGSLSCLAYNQGDRIHSGVGHAGKNQVDEAVTAGKGH